MAALQLTEIFEVVCEFLASDRPALACLACTCRTFEEPALDVLWRVMDVGLKPLVRLLPDSIWILEDADSTAGVDSELYGSEQYRLTRPLSPQQWNLMRKYTSRIAMISLPYADPSSSRLQAIAVQSPPTFESLPPLFPKLKAVHGASLRPGRVAFFFWLNGPSLTQLGIDFFEGDLACQALTDFVSDMGTIYPNMKTFSFNPQCYMELPDAMILGLSKTLRDWKHLVRADLNSLNLDTAAYEHLMGLESLTSLTLRIFYRRLPHLKQAVLPPRPFPMLRDLTLIDCDRPIPWMVEWLGCLHLSPHNLFCIMNSSIHGHHEQIANLFRTIAAQLCHKSLETIALVDHFNPASVRVESIRPLFSFSRLRCVDIGDICTVSLSDDDLLELATSWPNLQALTLSKYVKETRIPAICVPTFKCFCHLLQHCPHLEKLSIVIDTRDSEWVDVSRPIVRNHPMNYLCLGNSFLNDTKRVASILLSTLPSLKQVDLFCWDRLSDLLYVPGRESLLALWRDVNHHLGELRR